MNTTLNAGDHVGRVLIVDDERSNREVIEAMLSREGLDLVQARNGAEALASVAQQPPDLILLDIMMPDMDGFEVTTLLKGDPATKQIPIILVTSIDDRMARLRGLEAGAEDFLSKPLDRVQLSLRVRNLLRLKSYIDYHAMHSGMTGDIRAPATNLVESDAIYRRIVESTTQGVWVIDASGNTTFLNFRMAAMLGCEESQVMGRSPTEFLYEEDRDAFMENLARLKGGVSTQMEARYRKCDGTPLWVLLESTSLQGAAGLSEGVLFMVADVTDRRMAEPALRAGGSSWQDVVASR